MSPVFGLYARLLGVPASTCPIGDPQYTTFVINNYPPGTHDDDPADKLLLLEHADNSVLTVLHQEGDYAGLQAQQPNGSWSPVPIVPGALQIFTGSLFTRWTNGGRRGERAVTVSGRHPVPAGDITWDPSWAVIGSEDKVIPPGVKRSQAERAGAKATEVDGSHVSLVSHPEVVVDTILAAAAGVAD